MPTKAGSESIEKLAAHLNAMSAAGWAVAPALAEFAAKNPAFRRVETSFRRYMDEQRNCLQSIYALLGGRLDDLKGAGASVRPAGERASEPVTSSAMSERRRGGRLSDRRAGGGADARPERRARRRRRTEP